MKTKKEEQQESIDTHLELLKYTTQVQSIIKENITSDFTLCKLQEQDKTGITEMTVNAHTAKHKIDQINQRSQYHKWHNGQWHKTTNTKAQQKIAGLANETFQMYMTKIQMTAILNRNVPNNHMLDFLQNTQPQTDQEPEQTTEQKIQQKITRVLKKEQPSEQ